MKLHLQIIAFFLCFFICCNNAYSNTSIAIIDKDKITSEALVFQSIRTQIDKKRIDLQAIFSQKEEQLRQAEIDLEHQKDLLSREVFDEKVKNFNKLVTEVQKEVSVKRSELENIYMNSMDVTYNKIKHITNKIAKEQKLDLILFLFKKNQVFYSNDKVDISDRVIEILNKELPSLDIDKISKTGDKHEN